MKEKNPIDHVRFYMKSDPEKPIQIRKDEVRYTAYSSFNKLFYLISLKFGFFAILIHDNYFYIHLLYSFMCTFV